MGETSSSSWLAALADRWPLPDDEDGFVALARDHVSVAAAWAGDTPAQLLVWLAARLAPTASALRAVLDTTRLLVAQHTALIPASYLDAGAQLAAACDAVAPHDDREAWGRARVHGVICSAAAACGRALAEAAWLTTYVRDDDSWRRPGAREIPALLASAVGYAQAAYGNYNSEFRGAFARLADGDRLVRDRHVLTPDGTIVARIRHAQASSPSP